MGFWIPENFSAPTRAYWADYFSILNMIIKDTIHPIHPNIHPPIRLFTYPSRCPFIYLQLLCIYHVPGKFYVLGYSWGCCVAQLQGVTFTQVFT